MNVLSEKESVVKGGSWAAVLAPVCLALAPVLSLAGHNAGDLEFGRMGWILLAAAGLAVMVTGVLSLVLRGVVRGGLAASLFMALFFAYGHVFDLVRKARWIKASDGIHLLVGGISLVVLAAGIAAVWSTRRDLRMMSKGVTFAGVVLLALSIVNLPYAELFGHAPKAGKRGKGRKAAAVEVVRNRTAPAVMKDDPARPDVYYIILDGYARADVLKAVHGFDNSEFLEALKARGFLVAEKSMANYAYTHFSLSSSLNMDYVEKVLKAAGRGESGRVPSYQAIQNPRVGRIFQSHGYRFYHLATNWSGTEKSALADVVLRQRPLWLQSEFMEVLIRTTALRLFEPNVADIHLYGFRTLKQLPSIEGPKFVFAHFLVPHKPYVFDHLGHVRKDVPLALQWKDNDGGWQNRQAYIEQLRFVNGMVLDMIDGIMAKSRTRPWIVLQSDHGTAALQGYAKPAPGDPGMEAFIRERLSNFTAVLAPDEAKAKFPDTVSPVNIFRILLDELFHEGLEILPDRHYIGSKREQFTEVGEIVRQGAPDPELVKKLLEGDMATGSADPEDR